MTVARKTWLFIRLTRPLFLAGGVLVYLLGAEIAWKGGAHINLFRLFLGQAMVTFTQLMTHYANEYFDQASDRLNVRRTWFSGGSGVLAAGPVRDTGGVSPLVALRAAQASAGVAAICLIVSAIHVPILFPIGILGLFVGWFYSSPPLALSGSGWGELVASVVVAGLVPLAGYASQAGIPKNTPIGLVCLALGLLNLAMLIAFTIPDLPADQRAGKRTLAVRLGLPVVSVIHNLLLLSAFGIILTLAITGQAGAHFAWLALPLAIWQVVDIQRYLRPTTTRFNGLTLRAVAIFTLTVLLWLAGFLF